MNYRAFTEARKGISLSSLFHLVLLAVCAMGMFAQAQLPANYYDSASGLTGQDLADALHEIIDDHNRFPYTSSSTDVWDILSAADEDPANMNNIITVYSNESKPKSDHTSGSGWNREHSWPKSLGFPDDGSCNYPYTDTHHLFASDWNYNSARSNRPFDYCSGCTEWVAYNASSSNYGGGGFTDGSWEVWMGRRGDLARAMFYMAIRYNGGTHGITGCSEPDLRLTDDRSLINTTSGGIAYMGILNTLLNWHVDDPVDVNEQMRNDVIYSFQGNRNPFVDHPEWVAEIFGTGDGSGGSNGGGDNGGGDNGGGDNGTVDGVLWINEIHYDNSSTDSAEGIEIAGPAGTDTTGWSLVAYNGNGGTAYSTTNLSGVLADQGRGFDFVFYAISGLQNGAPDGIALVNPAGDVVQFLSYEGSFAATDGPANGLTATDIGVAETSSTPVGHSLQLTGEGSQYSDFTWAEADTATANATNNNQIVSLPSTGEGALWINEIHYDNSSTDSGEGIEIAGPAGTDTTGWTLVAYNGNGGTSYNTTSLSGILDDQVNGYGFAWYPITGLQNGSPDGVALVDPTGVVVQFLSYEGSFAATDGPATGITATDIGISESSSTPVGSSLQLTGDGTSYADFSWTAADNTIAALNQGQTFGGSDGSNGGGGDGGNAEAAIWINEIHYDNSSTDSGEGIEIAGPAGTDTTGWSLVAYNGNGGASYNTTSLSGTLSDQNNGYGFVWYAISGLQNGSPDGVALVDPSGSVVQFLSYEGSFTAVDGPAAGLDSEDIGVSEPSDTPVGYSLQLGGMGTSYADFTWYAADAATTDAINNQQSFPAPIVGEPWINEIHYDNSSTDVNEGIEIAGPAGFDLTGWSLEGYNGNGGASYGTEALSGTIDHEMAGYGALWFPFSGLQNGYPDGIALVDPNGVVVQFLSYEGSFTAVDGPAAGMLATDIGVYESSSTALDYSLQLAGNGIEYAAFSWQAPVPHSRGDLNSGQLMTAIVDLDNDGVADEVDTCLNSDMSATLVINNCDSGVANGILASGCTLADLIAAEAAIATARWRFTSAIQTLARDWQDAGYLSADDVNALMNCANQWGLPNPADDAYTTPWDLVLNVAAPGVLANDDDAEGDVLEAHLLTAPATGSLSLHRDGSFSYTPQRDLAGPVSFVYKAWDGSGYRTATVTITVTEGNHAPVAQNDSFQVTAGTRLTVNAPGVLANDHDVDGDPLWAHLVSSPNVGHLGFHQDGSFWYDAPAGFSGTVSFSYKASDGDAKGEAVVTIEVLP